MKMRTKVINELDSWQSDWSGDITKEMLDDFKKLLKRVGDCEYLSLQFGKSEIFFPPEILKHSVIEVEVG